MNKRLGLSGEDTSVTLSKEDIVAIITELVKLQNGKSNVDDIDHLGNRRVRTVGEQLQSQFSLGLARMARTIKERMNLRDADKFTPQDLVNARTVSSVINTFFGTNQLSQFMDQTNPLAELTHKRRMSALGPGGLTRERAGFEVRDVHYTHYGRLCPIETPEGPNIGLISSLCTHGVVNQFGFIETPYRKVNNGKVTKKIEYLSAEDEDRYTIAQANAPLNADGTYANDLVRARIGGDVPLVSPDEIDYMDVAPNQIISPAASLIPFLEHDDANRALMGSNMQRQAVPLLQPSAPFVGTGLEGRIARDSRAILVAEGDGTVEYVDATKITVRYDETPEDADAAFEEPVRTYALVKFRRTNQDTNVTQKPRVAAGMKVKKGDLLADGASTEQRRAGARQERARRVHALEGLQLRGRHRHLGEGGQAGHLHLGPHRGVRPPGPRHQARRGGADARDPERLRGGDQGPRRARHRPRSAPRSTPATSSSARSRPRARPTRRPRRSCSAPSSATRPATSRTPRSRPSRA